MPTEIEILEEKQRLLQVALGQVQVQAPVADQAATAAPARKMANRKRIARKATKKSSSRGTRSSHNDDSSQEFSEVRYDHLNKNDDFVYFKLKIFS